MHADKKLDTSTVKATLRLFYSIDCLDKFILFHSYWRKKARRLIRRKKQKRFKFQIIIKTSFYKKSITVTDDYNKNELILNVQAFLRHEFIEKYIRFIGHALNLISNIGRPHQTSHNYSDILYSVHYLIKAGLYIGIDMIMVA